MNLQSNKKVNKKNPNIEEIERLLAEQSAKPFDTTEAVENPGLSDNELEKFLSWRREICEAEREAQKSWQL